MGVHRNFCRGGNVNISLVLFQVANDAMQMDFHKTLYPFFTTKKIPHESTRSARIFLKCYSGGVVFEFAKDCTFCHPLQLLLNCGILQYHYYCEQQTTESELDLNCPQLRLRCSVAYAENFHGGGFVQWHTNVLAKFVNIICIFFNTHSPYFMCHCTEYKLSALQVRISEEHTLNATTQQFINAKISGCTLKPGVKHVHHCVTASYNCKMRLRYVLSNTSSRA